MRNEIIKKLKKFRYIKSEGFPMEKSILFLILLIINVIILFYSCTVFADDILKGTETTLVDTLNGTGKKYLYITEGITGLITYIKTKNVIVLAGIVILSIAFNIIIKIATNS